MSRDGFGDGVHLIFIRGPEATMPGSIDELTYQFIERFREDPAAAKAWAEKQPELRGEIELARRLVRAQYEADPHEAGGYDLSFRLFDKDGPVASERPHIAILISGAPFFVESEALEGF